MTARDIFRRTLQFKKSERLPMVEWAAWWDKTVERWKGEGMPEMSWEESLDFFGLDKLYCILASPGTDINEKIKDEADYDRILPSLYREENIENLLETARALKPAHDRGEIIIRLWLDGFFWFPRELLGIENHLYSFYDQPELIHRINSDLAEFHKKTVSRLFEIIVPDMVGFAEDMSYNNGPMLSEEFFEEFIRPYYEQIIPSVKAHGSRVFVDTDGQVEPMIPWLLRSGVEGVYPLEHQAGVDINKLRNDYPTLLMMGGYDKMVMNRGEEAMRAEFERILPVMRSGGYIPSVDHQTPPGVSLDDYKIYIKLFKEYTKKAVQDI